MSEIEPTVSAFPFFTLLLYRPSVYDSRCGNYYESEFSTFGSHDYDRVTEKLREVVYANEAKDNYEDTEITLLIDGASYDDAICNIGLPSDEMNKQFSAFDTLIRQMKLDYRAEADDRKRREAKAAAERAEAQAKQRAEEEERRERDLLARLSQKYGNPGAKHQ